MRPVPNVRMEECCVCLEPTANVVQPCQHVMCPSCAGKWSIRDLRCPVCKRVLVAHARCPPSGDVVLPRTMDPDDLLIVDTKDHGVQIEAVYTAAIASKFPPGSYLSHVNGIAVFSSDAVCTIVEACRGVGFPVLVRVTKHHPARRPWCWLACFPHRLVSTVS